MERQKTLLDDFSKFAKSEQHTDVLFIIEEADAQVPGTDDSHKRHKTRL